jgi:hypothetical protein
MSIVTARRVIGVGDHVMVYENFQKITPVVMLPGARFQVPIHPYIHTSILSLLSATDDDLLFVQNRFGEFRHDDLIGTPYGTKVICIYYWNIIISQ